MRKERNIRNKNLGGEIQKINIPDKDIMEWFKVLSEGGDMSTEEINSILSHLNETYGNQMALTDKKIRELLQNIIIDEVKKYLYEKHNIFVLSTPNSDFENFIKELVKKYLTLNNKFNKKEILEEIKKELDKKFGGK